jgi:CheY-like chemotaxis protein
MKIFIAEDNPADIYLLRIAFDEAGQRDADLIVASDGEEALNFVARRGPFRNIGRPDLIVLDLNLPKSDGTDVLRAVRESVEYAETPVVVLTSSDSPEDRECARKLGATCFITKPSDLEAFMGLGHQLIALVGGSGAKWVAAG